MFHSASFKPCLGPSLGTTVTLTHLFVNYPVRQQEFRRHARREYFKCVDLIQSYAIGVVGVRITMSNTTDKG